MNIVEAHYRKHARKLSQRFARFTGSKESGEDVVQEAYYRALRSIGSFNPEGMFEKWFSRILKNSLNDFLNAERGHILEEYDEELGEGIGNLEYNSLLLKQILIDIKEYDEEYQEVVRLYFQHGYSPRDISQITDVKKKAVEKFLTQFKKRIRESHAECVDR